MSNMKKWVSGALSVGAAAALVFLLTELGPDKPGDAGGAIAQSASVAQPGPVGSGGALPGAPGANAQAARPPLTLDSPWSVLPPGASPALEVSPLSTMSPPRFSADSQGRLVLNSDTHANLEKLLLQENPDAMRATLDRIAKDLPAQAAAELRVLVGQFQQYTKALSHTVSPENAPETEQEGIKLLESLHTLRVSYLGPEATRAMFGAEEATTRQLIALMAAEKDPTLTPQQKAERAQEIMNSKPQPAPPAS